MYSLRFRPSDFQRKKNIDCGLPYQENRDCRAPNHKGNWRVKKTPKQKDAKTWTGNHFFSFDIPKKVVDLIVSLIFFFFLDPVTGPESVGQIQKNLEAGMEICDKEAQTVCFVSKVTHLSLSDLFTIRLVDSVHSYSGWLSVHCDSVWSVHIYFFDQFIGEMKDFSVDLLFCFFFPLPVLSCVLVPF